ncbi:MAG: peptidylprolyl isomerase [bacterium]
MAPVDAPTDAPSPVSPTDLPSPDAPSDVPSEVPSDASSPSGVPSPEASATTVDLDCAQPQPTRPDDLSWAAAPETTLEAATDYAMTLVTNCGDIVIALEPQEAPATTASMAFLADEGYFDLTACHRLTTEGIYVLQCGDPKGDGTGGPGYSIPDENLPPAGADNYPAGTVAMANAGPGTGGSQFFIVYENTTLPSGYTIWGTVTQGLDVVRGIASAGVEGGGSDGPPAQPVIIEKATVTPAARG